VTIRDILVRGQPGSAVLTQKAAPVEAFDASLEQLIADLWDTMKAHNGAGLAAPQIGVSQRVCVVRTASTVLINPVYLARSGTTIGDEGCLSLPGFIGTHIERFANVDLTSRTPTGAEQLLVASDTYARAIQHEIDHLDGILITQRVSKSYYFVPEMLYWHRAGLITESP
jgi:peptide deformylase